VDMERNAGLEAWTRNGSGRDDRARWHTHSAVRAEDSLNVMAARKTDHGIPPLR
jgi:hypothetical protein